MKDTVATIDGRIVKVQGPARSGKTETLIRRCVQLVKEGTAPESILVEVTSAFAAQTFRTRLAQALGDADAPAANAVSICTALDACVAVLSSSVAQKATGRVPRLLTAGEYNFFLEDMKTLGEPIRRLRKMLAYFYRQMSDNKPRETWVLGGEEEAVLAHLERVLTLRDSMLTQEAPALCASFLESDSGETARGSFSFVLCDDFQNLSHAEQTCLCLLADQQLIVCGNPNEQRSTHTANPYAEGFTKFNNVRRDVRVIELSGAYGNKDIIAFTDALCDQGAMDPAFKANKSRDILKGGVQLIKWATPEEEINGITKYLRVTLDAEDNLHENRTCVVVPNKRWALLVEKVLKQRGFSVSAAGACSSLGGDPRERKRAKALIAYTKLNLLANPRDMVAWRSWCGFDNFLTNSDAWSGLQDFADQQGLALYDALKRVAELEVEPFLRASVLAERWYSGQEFLTKNIDRKGFDLLRAIDAEQLPEFSDLEHLIIGDENALQLYLMERDCVNNPSFPDDPHTLHVSSFDTLCATDYDNVFVIGAVDGFIPCRNAFEVISTEDSRDQLINEERRRFYNAVIKAGKRLIISYFSKADLELAEYTKMQVVRVKAEGGNRVAILRPSHFLTEAGNACPGTVGGQSLLAEHGLA